MFASFRVAVVNAFLMSKGKPVSRKLVKSIITAACVYAVTFAVTRLGYKLDVAQTAIVAQVAAAVGAFVSGWLTTEFPQIVQDDESAPVVPDPEPVSVPVSSPEPVAELRLSVPRPAPVTELLKPAEPVKADADADTVTMPVIRDEPVRERFKGPREVGPRTVV